MKGDDYNKERDLAHQKMLHTHTVTMMLSMSLYSFGGSLVGKGGLQRWASYIALTSQSMVYSTYIMVYNFVIQ